MTAIGSNGAVHLEPHNLEAEQAVLGSCLFDRDVVLRLAPYLEPDDFFIAGHQRIWSAIVGLAGRRIPTDLVTLVSELRRLGWLDEAGGEMALAELLSAVPTAVHADYYMGLVRETGMRRRMVRAAQRIATVAYNEALPLMDAVTQAEDALHEASRLGSREGFRGMAEVVETVFASLGEYRDPPLLLGFHDLDRLQGGIRRGQLLVWAARPSVGKSAIGIQALTTIAKGDVPVGILSLEMSEEEIVDRIVAFTAGVNMHAVRSDNEPPPLERISSALGKIAQWPLFMDCHSNGQLSDVLARCRAMVAQQGIRVLLIDYVQLIEAGGGDGRRPAGTRAEEVSRSTRALKLLARELGIAVIALSQINRDIEKRSNPVPLLSDLSESGSLERDSDVVMFIHRPDLYADDAEKLVAELHIAKHRNGPVGTVRMRFDPVHSQFTAYGWSD